MPTDTHRSPGELIDALLRERGWDQAVLGMFLGIDRTGVSRLVSNRKKIDAETALELSYAFGLPAERFLQQQQHYDLEIARMSAKPDDRRLDRALLYRQLPIAEMIQRGWIRAESSRDVSRVESELTRFFDVSDTSQIPILPHAAKKSDAEGDVTSPQLAWIYRVKQVARQLVTPAYSRSKAIAAIEKLRVLLLSAEDVKKVPRIMAEAGIRFVIVESLKSAKIDGVCASLGPGAPIIGMSLRLDRLDNFWFVLRHELEHVLRGHGQDAFVLDAELDGERGGTGHSVTEQERLANEAAADFCVPTKSIDQFMARKAPIFAERDVLGFARTLRIHPGLVAGQIHRRTERYELFRKYLVKVRSIISPNAMVDGWGDVAPTGA
jgi:HTH-type transcriptional regulator/antitoxin HigA